VRTGSWACVECFDWRPERRESNSRFIFLNALFIPR
jgi:hypothetical protein